MEIKTFFVYKRLSLVADYNSIIIEISIIILFIYIWLLLVTKVDQVQACIK